MSNALLLISGHPDDLAFATVVTQSAGLELLHASDAPSGVKLLDEASPTVIFVAVDSEQQYRAFEDKVQETIGIFSEKISLNSLHFISSHDLEQVSFVLQSPLFGHFILRNYHDVGEAGRHYGRILKHSLSKRAFGLAGILGAGAKIQTDKLQYSNQKLDAVEAVRNFVNAAKFQGRMALTIANSIDELLMNAMFDAPVDEIGRPLYKATARSTQIKLDGKASVEMQVGFDGNYIGITSIDLFGSLEKPMLLRHLSKIYTAEEYKIKTSTASAGIGLGTVYRSGGSLFFASESGARTEVTVLFKRTDNYRDFKDQFRFISTQFYF